jgi:hypothetical protein
LRTNIGCGSGPRSQAVTRRNFVGNNRWVRDLTNRVSSPLTRPQGRPQLFPPRSWGRLLWRWPAGFGEAVWGSCVGRLGLAAPRRIRRLRRTTVLAKSRPTRPLLMRHASQHGQSLGGSPTPLERNIIARRRWSLSGAPEIPPASLCRYSRRKVQKNPVPPGTEGGLLESIPSFRHDPPTSPPEENFPPRLAAPAWTTPGPFCARRVGGSNETGREPEHTSGEAR